MTLILLAFSLLGLPQSPASSRNETKKYAFVQEIFKLTGVGDFVRMVGNISVGKDVSPANPFKGPTDLTSEERSYWKNFPEKDYVFGLRKQFLNLFSEAELATIVSFYKNPFRAKILILLNTDAFLGGFHEKMIFVKSSGGQISKNKITLIQSIVNLHKLNPLIEDQKEALKSEIRRNRKLIEILSKGNGGDLKKELAKKEKNLKDFDVKILKYFASAFIDVRESELRELTRVMADKKVQDAAQLLVNYHYFYLKKYAEEFRRLQKGKEQKKEEFDLTL